MVKQVKSFSVTLFCSMHEWGTILPSVIIPFLETYTKGNACHSFYLTMNCAGKEHLRVLLTSDAEKFDTMITGAETWFADFFSGTHGFNNQPVVAVEDSNRFLNETGQMSIADNYYCAASNVIVKALSGKDITVETLLTYAYCLHIALIGILAAHFNKEPLVFTPVYDPASQVLHPETSLSNDQIVSTFERNKAFVLGTAAILLPIVQAEEQTDEVPEFISEWVKAVSNEIVKALSADNNYLPHTLHRYFVLLINSQLGLTNNMKAVLYYFIYQGVCETYNATNGVIIHK